MRDSQTETLTCITFSSREPPSETDKSSRYWREHENEKESDTLQERATGVAMSSDGLDHERRKRKLMRSDPGQIGIERSGTTGVQQIKLRLLFEKAAKNDQHATG